jgi:transportin-1
MNMSEADERLRSVAGLVLKNNAVSQFNTWPPHVVDYVKQIIMSTFHDQPTMVRNSAGGVIVAILDMVGPAAWPEVLQLLLQSLDSSSIDQQLVSHQAFSFQSVTLLNLVYPFKGCVQRLSEGM